MLAKTPALTASARNLRVALWLLCSAFLLGAVETSALNPERLPSQYLFERYGRDTGLPSDTIWVTREGPNGYLWIGTRAGLARFDGARFTVYNEKTHPQFAANDIRDLEWTPSGELWIATYGGGVILMRGDQFTVLREADGLVSDMVYDIYRASDGAMWFATGGGVSRYADGKWQSWTTADGMAADRIFKSAEADDGTMWFGGYFGGLNYYDGSSLHTVGQKDGLDSLQVHMLTNDPELGIVAGTATGSVYQLSTGGGVTRLPLSQTFTVEEFFRDSDGNEWIASYGSGLWRRNADGASVPVTLSEDIHITYTMDIMEDRSGNLWVSTALGLFRIRDSVFLSLGAGEGLADSTYVVSGEKTGDFWVGAEKAGLFKVSANGAPSRPYPELANSDISSLLVRNNGSLWVGTFGTGLYFNAAAGAALRQFDTKDGLSSAFVLALNESRDGTVWIGTNTGVSRWRETEVAETADKTGDTHALETVAEFGNWTYRHINEGRDGRLWFSSSNGLYEYRSDGDIRRWSTDDGLASNLVTATYEDARGVLWIAMRDGSLARLWNDQLFDYGNYPSINRLSAFGILEDRSRNLWISGETGLLRVSRDNLDALARGEDIDVQATVFDEEAGLRSGQFLGGFQPSAWAGPDNRLWFSTQRGLVGFHPRSLTGGPRALKTFIEEVRVDGKIVPLESPLRLPSSMRRLEIDYTAPELSGAISINFRYRSVESDQLWENVGSRRTAYFNSLPAGESVFRVQATLGQGPFPDAYEDSATLTVFREPRWYETTWSVLAASLFVIILLTLSQRLLSRRARAREHELRELVNLRTDELQQAVKRVEANARIDSLTGIANRRHMDERLTSAWNMAQRSAVPISILMIDIDRFKQYNDKLGHNAGDECLRQIAKAISDKIVRENDMVARYGGEEFLVLLYDSDAAGAAIAAQRLIECVRHMEIPHPDSDVARHVTVCVGHATDTPKQNVNPYALVKLADIALYEAKNSGRDSIANA